MIVGRLDWTKERCWRTDRKVLDFDQQVDHILHMCQLYFACKWFSDLYALLKPRIVTFALLTSSYFYLSDTCTSINIFMFASFTKVQAENFEKRKSFGLNSLLQIVSDTRPKPGDFLETTCTPSLSNYPVHFSLEFTTCTCIFKNGRKK